MDEDLIMSTLRFAAASFVVVEFALIVESVRNPDEVVSLERFWAAEDRDVLGDRGAPFWMTKLLRRGMAELASSRVLGCRCCQAEKDRVICLFQQFKREIY